MKFDPTHVIVPFGLVLARVGTFIAACPLFVPDSVAVSLRAGLSVMLSLALTANLTKFTWPDPFVPAFLCEVLVGAAFALSVRLVGVAISFAGELFDVHLGFGFARLMNPAMGEENTPLMQLAYLLGQLTFLLAGGQHHVVVALTRSLSWFVPGSGSFSLDWVQLLAGHYAEVLQLGVLMALPIVVSMLCVQLGLAMLSRLAPQLNIWALGLLGTCGLGLLALYGFVPAWTESMSLLWRGQDTWLFGDAA